MIVSDQSEVLRPSAVVRTSAFGVGLVLALAGIALACASTPGNTGSVAIGAALALCGLMIGLLPQKAKVTLSATHIDQFELWHQRSLARQDIAGYRTRKIKGTTLTDLLPNRPELKKITLSATFTKNPLLQSWLVGLSDLDQEERLAVARAIEQDQSLGDSAATRTARAAALRRGGNALMIAGCVAVVGLAFFPQPVWLAAAVAMLLPWLAMGLVAQSPANFTLIEFDKATLLRKVSLLQWLIMPIAAFYAILNNPEAGLPRLPVQWQDVVAPAVVGGLVMFALVLRVSRGAHRLWTQLAMISIALMVTAGGSLVFANCLFDAAPAGAHLVSVTGKYRTHGKGAADYLTLSDQAQSNHDTRSIRVAPDFYQTTAIGQAVCTQLHPGALGMPWQTVGAAAQCVR